MAAVITAQATSVFAAGSGSSSDSEPSYSDNPNSTTVSVNADGVKTTGVVTSTDNRGSSIAVAVNITTESGITVRTNSRGEAVVGDKVVAFAKGDAATAGLPAAAVSDINEINSGKLLSSFITGFDLTKYDPIVNGKIMDLAKAPGLDLTGYNALTATHAIVTRDASTRAVNDTATETVIYVPNLIEGLGEISVLYYDNATGHWLLLPTSKVDVQSKLVYVKVTGSGTLSVVYKK